MVQARAPAAPGPGEVLLRVEACALGQWDWNLVTRDVPPRLPLVPGVEAVGVVEGVGAGVSLAPGARVLVTPLASSCGTCAACAAGEARWCRQARFVGADLDGALGTHLTLPAQHLVAAPSVAAEEGACLGGSAWTAVGAVQATRLASGARLGVIGVGGVGHLVVQVARARGLEVAVADVDPARVAWAARWVAAARSERPNVQARANDGATAGGRGDERRAKAGEAMGVDRGRDAPESGGDAALFSDAPWTALARDGDSTEARRSRGGPALPARGGDGAPSFGAAEPVGEVHVDAAVVCTPSAQALQRAVRTVRPGGVVVVVGSSPTGRVDLPLADVVARGVVVVGSALGSAVDLAEAVTLAELGRLRPMVDVAPLDMAVERLWWLRDGGFVGRLVFVP